MKLFALKPENAEIISVQPQLYRSLGFFPLCKRQLQALTITEPCLPTKTGYLHSNIVADTA